MATRASTFLAVASAVAGITFLIGNTDDAAAQDATSAATINNARGVRAALTACWNALGEAAPATAQVSVRLSFDRDGKVFGQPLITYANPAPSEEGREAVRDAVARALKLCEPLPLRDTFRDVVAVHPIGVRLGNGWKRRVRSER
jgi:hypothetical protein